ncbi:type II secretion system protein GspE [bacterium E08(2017)]|nr:type II secretion system protein GspE [bacterium E08(2017)]
MTSNDDYVLELLLENGYVSHDQIEQLQYEPREPGETTVDSLITLEILQEADVLALLGSQFGMEVVDLHGVNISPDIRDLLTVDLVRRYRVIPLKNQDGTITVALSDPLDFDTLDSLRHVLGTNVEGVIASRTELKALIEKYYAIDSDMDAILDQMDDSGVDVAAHAGMEELADDADSTESDAPIIKLVSLIILEAFKNRASDIHLEPMEKKFKVRYRVDGVLQEVDSPPKRLQAAILSRVKIMSSMNIAEKRIPQDGRIQVNILGRELDLRVSTVPTNHGESIVMRILDKQSLSLGLPQLGFFADDQQTFERLIGMSDGIILVTGPTGSGKTTTLYACLNQINRPDRKIITVEDPVEYQLSGINQVQVRHDVGLTFEAALRSILRQAPNVVMIGEIRDRETANIATEASLTGHLVFSTLHTNDAPSAVTRLLDIGVKPFLVASSLRGIMAQRLIRCNCEECKEPYEPSDADLRLLGVGRETVSELSLMKGRGCAKCGLTGYSGRKGLFEIFVINDEIQRMIFEKEAASAVRKRARELGMRTLREDGIRKVNAGITTLDEVMRVTMGDAD